jgi:hypothetical protein
VDLSPTTVRGREPIERFKPTTGLAAGWIGLVLLVCVVGYAVAQEHSVLGLRVALGAALAGVLVWVTQLRPRVTAYDDGLLILGMVRDTFVPYVVVDEVVMGQTLNVWASGRRYVCIGIGRSLGSDMRARVRAQGHGGLSPTRSYNFSGQPLGEKGQTDTSYHDFVLDRITDLVRLAHERRAPAAAVPAVRRSWALPEVLVLVVVAVAFVVSLAF